MSWKPHWCAKAQEIAASSGLQIAENSDGVLVLIRPSDAQHFAIDLTEANKLATLAEALALALPKEA